MRRQWLVIEAAPDSSMMVVRFRPGGAYPFLGFAVNEITDTVDELEAVAGPAATSLRDRVLATPGVDGKMSAVESWLLERAAGGPEANPVIEYLAGRLFAPAGLRISDLVDEIGYSQRHVLGLFRRWVGLSPKQYGRIRRFQQVLASITQAGDGVDPELAAELRGAPPPEPDWADVATRHGYYDQSHLIHDFRDFAGLTPRGYVAGFRGLANYLPFD
jgi:AraC-like DNA-binding protein